MWAPSPALLAATQLPGERIGGWWLLDSGTPLGGDGIDETLAGPEYAAAIGLTRYGAAPRDRLAGLVEDAHLLHRVGRRMVGWLKELM